MEISESNYNKLLKLITTYSNNKNYELESRVHNEAFANYEINYKNFVDTMNYFILPKSNGGLELKYEYLQTLRVNTYSSDVRLEIENIDNIKLYWLRNNLDNIEHSFIRKIRNDKVDINEYYIRVCLSSEENVNDKEKNLNRNLILDSNEMKLYRMKNTIKVKYGNYDIYLSTVKQAKGTTFKSSKCLKEQEHYEIEVELNNTDIKPENILDELLEINGLIVLLIQGGDLLLNSKELSKVKNSYINLINKYVPYRKSDFIAANAVSISMKNLVKNKDKINIFNNYAVTLKADGIRHFLYVDNHGNIFLIDNSLKFKKFDIRSDKFIDTIIEGEYVSELDLFLMYDTLFVNGMDVRNNYLVYTKGEKKQKNKLSRYEYLNKFYNDIKQKNDDSINIEVKEYLFSSGNDIFEKIDKVWKSRLDKPYKNDGMIFTPIQEPYPQKAGVWFSLLKWKPQDQLSIDFLIEVEKDLDGTDKIYSEIKLSTEPGFDNENIRYKVVILKVGDNGDKFNRNQRKWIKSVIPVEFNPDNEEHSSYCRGKIIINSANKMLIEETREEIYDDTIVEFVYNKNISDFNWTPIKIRHDKTNQYKNGQSVYGNFSPVANDIWRKIMNPITEHMITTGDVGDDINADQSKAYYAEKVLNIQKRRPYQTFHNQYIKQPLIVDYSPGVGKKKMTGSLLDLSVGQGGDMYRWKKANLKTIVGVDIDKPGLLRAEDRYREGDFKFTLNLAWCDSSKLIFPNYVSAMNEEDKKKLKKYIPSKYMFDIVSLQFTLHYFFKSEKTLRGLLQNVTDNLKIGGHFIGTSFDGKRVFNLLKDNENDEGIDSNGKVMWSIKKLYDMSEYNTDKPNFNQKIEVFVETFGKVEEEFLVNYDYFTQMCKEYGLALVKISSFGEVYENIVNKDLGLSNIEKVFSFLNNIFVFIKENNAPNSVYQKYIK